MKIHEKLFQLRKKSGMTQAELAEALNVSRQAISKWEMGTTVPDINNMLSISKIFGVSIDYLVNDELETEGTSPIVDVTSSITKTNPANDELETEKNPPKTKSENKTIKINYQYILKRVITAFCVIICLSIIGVITHSPATMILYLVTIGFIFLIYYIVKLLILFFSNKKEK